jgi:hypothetical protein
MLSIPESSCPECVTLRGPLVFWASDRLSAVPECRTDARPTVNWGVELETLGIRGDEKLLCFVSDRFAWEIYVKDGKNVELVCMLLGTVGLSQVMQEALNRLKAGCDTD